MPTNTEPSGKVYIKDGKIIWEYKSEVISEIAINEIKLIGEYTTAEGPVVDDWFIVFMTAKDEWNQISEYAIGVEELLQQLSNIFNTSIVGTLFASTTWNTNIIWPPEVKGEKMWHVSQRQKTTLSDKLKAFFGFGDSNEIGRAHV